MIDLYAAPTANGLRAKVVLEETGLPFKLTFVDLAKGENKMPEYMKLNPFGVIPTIVDSDGPGGKRVVVAQSIAIMIYAGDKSGKFIPKDGAKRAVFWDALMSAATDAGPILSSVFAIHRSKEPHKPSQAIFEDKFRGLLKVWNETLGRQKYCAGEEVTLADFALYCVTARVRQVIPALAQGYPALEKWEQEIGQRPGVKKGMTEGWPAPR